LLRHLVGMKAATICGDRRSEFVGYLLWINWINLHCVFVVNVKYALIIVSINMVDLVYIDAIFQLYRGGQLYWWRKSEYPNLSKVSDKQLMLYRVHLAISGFKVTNLVVIGTDHDHMGKIQKWISFEPPFLLIFGLRNM
jgi:hypothetical protein